MHDYDYGVEQLLAKNYNPWHPYIHHISLEINYFAKRNFLSIAKGYKK
jgi:hypothetical protein